MKLCKRSLERHYRVKYAVQKGDRKHYKAEAEKLDGCVFYFYLLVKFLENFSILLL